MERQRGNELDATTREVAARVRTLRIARGWTLDELSQRLGGAGRPIGVPALSKLEALKRRVDVDDLHALSKAFGVDESQLLGEVAAKVGLSASVRNAFELAGLFGRHGDLLRELEDVTLRIRELVEQDSRDVER